MLTVRSRSDAQDILTVFQRTNDSKLCVSVMGNCGVFSLCVTFCCLFRNCIKNLGMR